MSHEEFAKILLDGKISRREAIRRLTAKRQLPIGYALAIASYLLGLAASVVTDLPSSPVIVWAMALLGLIVHVAVRR